MIDLEKFLEKYYKNNEKIILACSTGPDSMFLLYKILETKYKNNLIVCYFNHKLRPEADKEEAWIEKLGKEKGFIVEIAETKIKEIRDKLYPSKGLEEVAREKRYAFFNAILNIYGSDKIITGHHLDDKIETFFFNLARGTKLTGIINMTEYSGSILRPLLKTEKKDILKYLNENKLDYYTDETNFDLDITRNFIRHEIVPKFSKINSNYKKNIGDTLVYFEELKNSIDSEVKTFLGTNNYFEIEKFNTLSNFMQKEVIRYIYFISNGKSTIGLSKTNISEIIKFINGKNNKTVKEIRKMKMKKDNKIIKF